MDIIYLLQYCLLNGFLIHRFFLKTESSTVLETVTVALLLSLSVNSIVLYFLSRVFQWPITRANVIILSLGIAGSIVCVHLITTYRQRHEQKTQRTARST